MTKPPAGASLLFGALADSGQIKQRKNGSYRMVLKGVDGINWFTDRPYRSEGIWNTRKLVRRWGKLFDIIQPNAQATFKHSSGDKLLTFEMYRPVIAERGEPMYFRIKPISARGKKIVSSTNNARLKEVSFLSMTRSLLLTTIVRQELVDMAIREKSFSAQDYQALICHKPRSRVAVSRAQKW